MSVPLSERWTEWRDAVNAPHAREYEFDFFGSDRARFTPPRRIHPLDRHVCEHELMLRDLLSIVNKADPPDLELLNRRTREHLSQCAEESAHLWIAARERFSDDGLCEALLAAISDVREWLEIASAAQMLAGVREAWATEHCVTCAHWCGGIVPERGGYCQARSHSRTGQSVACSQWEDAND